MKSNRQRAWIAAGALVAAALVVLAIVVLWPSTPDTPQPSPADTTANGPVRPSSRTLAPESATDAVHGILSGNRQQMKAALSPTLARHLPKGAPTSAPPGLRIKLTGWVQAGPFAAATARVSSDDDATDLYVGFRQVGNRWRITQIGPASR